MKAIGRFFGGIAKGIWHGLKSAVRWFRTASWWKVALVGAAAVAIAIPFGKAFIKGGNAAGGIPGTVMKVAGVGMTAVGYGAAVGAGVEIGARAVEGVVNPRARDRYAAKDAAKQIQQQQQSQPGSTSTVTTSGTTTVLAPSDQLDLELSTSEQNQLVAELDQQEAQANANGLGFVAAMGN